jgi:uncharacterized protein (TIGR02145 family)
VNYANLYPVNSVFCNPGGSAVITVTNPTTGKIWMDRNLGATQVATSSTYAAAYGDLYQWGRRSDGHQCRTSTTTAFSIFPNTDQPNNGFFITVPSSPFDWRAPQNNNLWQGVNGINNPCPSGYRLPTEAEQIQESSSWVTANAAGALASPLKLSLAGNRGSDGALLNVNSFGTYWSSTVSGTNSIGLRFANTTATTLGNTRATGRSVRCIKN